MPDTNNNGGLSLEALLAAARAAEEEAAEQQPASTPASEPASAAASAQQPVSAQSGSARAVARPAAASAAAGAAAAGTSAARAQAVPPAETVAAEPVAEPSATAQEAALERAEESAPAFDLMAALGYGSRESEPAPAAQEPEEKFDLMAALGYKSQEVREREAAEAAAMEAAAQAQAVQEQAYREAEQQVQRESGTQDVHDTQPTRPERAQRAEQPARAEVAQASRAEQPAQPEQPQPSDQPKQAEQPEQLEQPKQAERPAQPQQAERPKEAAPRAAREVASVREADAPQVRSRSFESTPKMVSPEERYAAKSADSSSATASDGSTIESYQPTKRDRSAQARAARPLKKDEVTEVAQAIAADAARTEYVEPAAEKAETAKPTPEKAQAPATASTAKPAATEKAAGARFTQESDQQAAPLAESEAAPKEAMPPVGEPVAVIDKTTIPPKDAPGPVGEPVKTSSSKPVDFTSPDFASSLANGAPDLGKSSSDKPVTMPHKVPVRTTEEIIKPIQAPVKLGVISPETVRHETATKKKVQSAERKIVKKVRRFRTLGMFLIVLALAALAGAVFLFVAGNAQANESIEATATEICEQAGRTITYRYKAADSNGTLCPTTEVATFSAGDVLEQSVITMNTPDFETAGHTLANFKKQFQDNSYVDGRVDGSTVIFTLHMSNERVMKVTYTALLMKNTTGCEVII